MSWLSKIKNVVLGTIVNVLKSPVAVLNPIQQKGLRLASFIGSVATAILAAPFSLPVSVVAVLTAVHTAADNAEDLLDNGKLDQSNKK